jgi:hypothetical protein
LEGCPRTREIVSWQANMSGLGKRKSEGDGSVFKHQNPSLETTA